MAAPANPPRRLSAIPAPMKSPAGQVLISRIVRNIAPNAGISPPAPCDKCAEKIKADPALICLGAHCFAYHEAFAKVAMPPPATPYEAYIHTRGNIAQWILLKQYESKSIELAKKFAEDHLAAYHKLIADAAAVSDETTNVELALQNRGKSAQASQSLLKSLKTIRRKRDRKRALCVDAEKVRCGKRYKDLAFAGAKAWKPLLDEFAGWINLAPGTFVARVARVAPVAPASLSGTSQSIKPEKTD
jgi:hypothetical protein